MTPWLTSILPVAAALLLLPAGTASRVRLAAVSSAALVASLALAASAAAESGAAAMVFAPSFALTAAVEPMNGTLLLLVPAVALPVALFAAAHEDRRGLPRLVALLLFFVGAMQLLLLASDLLTLFIAWELVGACSWALIAHEWRDAGNVRAAMRAFIVTRGGDLGLVLAAMAAWSGAGSFAFADLHELGDPLLGLAAAGIVVSAAAKSAQAPFSFWLFRAMSGPTSASALLHSATMVAAGAYLLLRLQPVLADAGWFGPAVIVVGLTTAVAGGVVAVLQSNSKKLFAASTSAHYGLMFVATGAGYPAAALLHLVTHAFCKSLLFMTAGIASAACGTRRLSRGRLGRALPITAAAAAVGTLALAGVPPLAAAMTKDLAVAAAGEAGRWLALAVILAGGLSACYAFRALWASFGPPGNTAAKLAERPGPAVHLALAIPVASTLVLSLMWLPPIKKEIGDRLGATLPQVDGWELVASVLLVVLGMLAGRWLANATPALGERGPEAAVADWFGLERLFDASITRPALRLAKSAASFDDRVLDRLPGAAAGAGRRASAWLSRGDDAVVDAGIRRTAAFGSWLSVAGARYAEAVADGVVLGLAWLVDRSGADLRRSETGLVHHYLVWIAGGALLVAIAATVAAAGN